MDPRKWFPSSSLFQASLCVYCGGKADTSDHTPPRCLLPKPLPEGLNAMTVPACSRCNVGFSQDELRTAAVISTVSFLESDRLSVAPGGRIYEQMGRNPKLGDFVSSRLGQDGMFQADLGVKSVIGRVMTKTAAGLLFYEFGRIVPLSDISVLAMEHARNANPSALAEMYRRDDNGWAEVTSSGRVLERQALSFLGYTSPHMPKWRAYIPEFFEYQFLRRSNDTMLTALLIHRALTVLLDCPWPSRAGPRRKGRPPGQKQPRGWSREGSATDQRRN